MPVNIMFFFNFAKNTLYSRMRINLKFCILWYTMKSFYIFNYVNMTELLSHMYNNNQTILILFHLCNLVYIWATKAAIATSPPPTATAGIDRCHLSQFGGSDSPMMLYIALSCIKKPKRAFIPPLESSIELSSLFADQEIYPPPVPVWRYNQSYLHSLPK